MTRFWFVIRSQWYHIWGKENPVFIQGLLWPDIGKDFRCWIDDWAQLRLQKSVGWKEFIPATSGTAVNLLIRNCAASVRSSCPSSARKKHVLLKWVTLCTKTQQSPSWRHFVGICMYKLSVNFLAHFNLIWFCWWLIRVTEKSTNICHVLSLLRVSGRVPVEG